MQGDELLSRDPRLDEVVQCLVEAYGPEWIYLFGSVARGEAGPDSDYDLLLLVPDGASQERRESGLAYQALRGTGTAADVTVWGRTPFERRSRVSCSLPGTVLREGTLLYEASSSCREPTSRAHAEYEDQVYLNALRRANRPVPGKVATVVAGGRDPELVAETRSWFARAHRDLMAGRVDLAAEPPLSGDAAFHAQQAAETAMKGFLTWHSCTCGKTHRLRELGALCARLDSTLDQELRRTAQLTEYAWKYRYPGDPAEPSSHEVEGALLLAREVYEEILSRLPGAVRP